MLDSILELLTPSKVTRTSGGNYGDVSVEAMAHRAILNQTTFDDALMWDAEPERSDRSQWSNIGTEPADHDF
jgi:hypothetical protein